MLRALLPVVLVEAVPLAVFMFLPTLRREKAFFGVRISPDVYRTEGRRIMRRYRLRLTACFVGITAVGSLLGVNTGKDIYFALATIQLAAAGVVLMTVSYREARMFRVSEPQTRFASSLATRKLGDYTTLPLEAVLTVAVAVPALALVYYYNVLPEMIPLRWDLQNNPVRWAPKNLISVFFLPALSLYIQAIFILLKKDMVGAKMMLPAAQADTFLVFKEHLHRTCMATMDAFRLFTALLFGTLSLNIIFTTLEQWRFMRHAVAVILIAGLCGALVGGVYSVYRVFRISNSLEKITGNFYVQRPGDESRWYGGRFYYNPNDPALLIEKLDGLGYTFNFANPRALIYLILVFGMILLCLWFGAST